MEVTIYIDVLWLRTFFIELQVCIFVNLWMKQMCPTIRILWMSALAVSAEVALFVCAGYGRLFAGGSLILRVLLLKLLFCPKSRGSFLRLFLWSIVATGAAGGILTVCQQQLPKAVWFAAGSCLCALSVLLSAILEERRELHDNRLYRVRLLHQEHAVELMALYDTGNRLIDPYVQEPVHIVAETEVKKLMPEPEKCRLIPFSTVGAPEGMLEVWTIDAMEWEGGKSRKERVVIGAAKDVLFEKKDYRMLLASGWKSWSKVR